jgi:hypothetical protein
MSVKFAGIRAVLTIALATFGVCSVSFESNAYPLTSQTIKISRSAREIPKTTKTTEVDNSSKGPFTPGSHNVSLGVGQVFLLGDLGNNHYDNSIGPEIHYNYGVSDLFAFESNFGYHSHPNGNYSASIWNLAAGLRANLMYFDQLIPFTSVALGFYHPSFSLPTNASVSSLLFGLQLGGGVDLVLSKQIFFGTRLSYNDMFDSSKKDSNGTLQSLGGSYFSFMIHIGMTF